jgi:hypothetical protein
MPKLSRFSLPWTRNLKRHQREPLGLTKRNNPPPSLNLKGFSRGFAPEITAFVSILGGVTPFGDDLLPPLLTPIWWLAINGVDRISLAQKHR